MIVQRHHPFVLAATVSGILLGAALVFLPRPSAAERRQGVIAAAEPALRRFVGLERLYFVRLDDPPAARRKASFQVENLPRLLPPALPEGEGPETEPRVVNDPDGPIEIFRETWSFELQDFLLPAPWSGPGNFLRQVSDDNDPLHHDRYWAIYAGGRRSDLWFFVHYEPGRRTHPRGGEKALAPFDVEEVLPQPDGTLVLRVSGAVVGREGNGYRYGTDLALTPGAGELRYRYAVRRYSFMLEHDRGEGRYGRVGVEDVHEEGGSTFLIRREYKGVLPPDRSAACGLDVVDGVPSASFGELVEIATCVTAWPGTRTVRRTLESPSYLERGWRPEG